MMLNKGTFVLEFSIHLVEHVQLLSFQFREEPTEIRKMQVQTADKEQLRGL